MSSPKRVSPYIPIEDQTAQVRQLRSVSPRARRSFPGNIHPADTQTMWMHNQLVDLSVVQEEQTVRIKALMDSQNGTVSQANSLVTELKILLNQSMAIKVNYATTRECYLGKLQKLNPG